MIQTRKNEHRLLSILLGPVISEKATMVADKNEQVVFEVARDANKLEIKKAVEMFYGVQVEDVNTMVMPSKLKAKYTKAGFIVGRKPSKKKALVTVAAGETIDLYGGI